MSNPYGLSYLWGSRISKVTYSAGMTLSPGQWTYDSDERAFWICPETTTNNGGYIRLIDSNMSIGAEDDIEIEFEIKCIGDASGQNIGIAIDLLKSDLSFKANMQIFSVSYSDEYETVRLKKRVNPSFTDVSNMALIFGVLTSPLLNTGYSIKIRNIRVSIIKNRTNLYPKNIWKDIALGAGWVNNDANGTSDTKLQYKKEGNRVFVRGTVKQTVSTTNKTIGTLPAECDPRVTHHSNIIAVQSVGDSFLGLQIKDTELLVRVGTITLNSWISFAFFYDVD